MYTGSYPYPTLNNAELVASLMDGERLDCPNNCPQTMYVISDIHEEVNIQVEGN